MSVREDLKAYVDGELSPERAEEVRLAVEADTALQQEVQFMKLLSDNIREEAVEPEVIGAEKALELARKPRRRFPLWLGYAAGGLAIIIFASVISPEFSQAKLAAKNSDLTALAGPERLKATFGAPPVATASSGASAGAGGFGRPAVPEHAAAKAASGAVGEVPEARDFSGTDPTLSGPQNGADAYTMTRENQVLGTNPSPPAKSPAAGKYLLPPPSNRKIIQNGDVEEVVPDVAIAQNQAAQIAASVGGFAENSSLSYSTQQIPTAAITLRVPAQFFGNVLQRVESLGKVTSNNVTGEDVTAQVADTDARVKELGAEEDDYVTMLRGARSIGQILEIKDRLSQVRQDLDSLKSQENALKDQSTLSTLNITFDQKPTTAPKPAPKPKPVEDRWAEDTFKSASDGLTAALHFLGRGVIVLFVYSPIWVPIAAIAWLVNRRVKRG